MFQSWHLYNVWKAGRTLDDRRLQLEWDTFVTSAKVEVMWSALFVCQSVYQSVCVFESRITLLQK